MSAISAGDVPTLNQNTTGTAAGLSATLTTTSGGTGLSSFTANGVVYASSTSALATSSALTFNGTNLSNTGRFIVNNAGSAAGTTDISLGSLSGGAWLNTPSATSGYLAVAGTGALRWDATTIVGSIGGTEGMRLNSTGLGIGTSSPASKLDVLSASNNIAQFSGAANGYVDFTNGTITGRIQTSGSVRFGSTTNHDLAFLQNNTEVGRFTSTGLGIGTTSPASKLHVTGTFGSQLRLQETSGTFFDVTGGGRFDIKNNAGTTIVSIAQSGNPVGTQLNLTSSGNLGLQVVPSAWDTYKVLQVGALGSVAFDGGSAMEMFSNVYYGTGSHRYISSSATAKPTRYTQGNGAHYWFTAPSGTAGNAITFTQAMTLDASGNLLVGATSQFGGADCKLQGKNGSSAQAVSFLWNATTTGDANFVAFGTEASVTQRGSITYNRAGGLTVYNTTSDYRAKDITGSVTDSGSIIDSVPVYIGKMKDATQERPMFIAHETPDYAHTGEKDAVDADGNPIYQQMDASALIPVMWAEIQSLRKRLADAGI